MRIFTHESMNENQTISRVILESGSTNKEEYLV